jgi:hypothetical protein
MKLLTWIMSRFNVPSELIGDIVEDSATHSRIWSLRQSTVAIVSTIAAGLCHQKLRTLAATALAWILWGGFAAVADRFYNPQFHHYTLAIALVAQFSFFVGLLFAWIQPSQPFGAVLLLIVTTYVWLAPTYAATIQMFYVHYPDSQPYIWPLALHVFAQNGSFILFTFLGAMIGRPKHQRFSNP